MTDVRTITIVGDSGVFFNSFSYLELKCNFHCDFISGNKLWREIEEIFDDDYVSVISFDTDAAYLVCARTNFPPVWKTIKKMKDRFQVSVIKTSETVPCQILTAALNQNLKRLFERNRWISNSGKKIVLKLGENLKKQNYASFYLEMILQDDGTTVFEMALDIVTGIRKNISESHKILQPWKFGNNLSSEEIQEKISSAGDSMELLACFIIPTGTLGYAIGILENPRNTHNHVSHFFLMRQLHMTTNLNSFPLQATYPILLNEDTEIVLAVKDLDQYKIEIHHCDMLLEPSGFSPAPYTFRLQQHQQVMQEIITVIKSWTLLESGTIRLKDLGGNSIFQVPNSSWISALECCDSALDDSFVFNLTNIAISEPYRLKKPDIFSRKEEFKVNKVEYLPSENSSKLSLTKAPLRIPTFNKRRRSNGDKEEIQIQNQMNNDKDMSVPPLNIGRMNTERIPNNNFKHPKAIIQKDDLKHFQRKTEDMVVLTEAINLTAKTNSLIQQQISEALSITKVKLPNTVDQKGTSKAKEKEVNRNGKGFTENKKIANTSANAEDVDRKMVIQKYKSGKLKELTVKVLKAFIVTHKLGKSTGKKDDLISVIASNILKVKE